MLVFRKGRQIESVCVSVYVWISQSVQMYAGNINVRLTTGTVMLVGYDLTPLTIKQTNIQTNKKTTGTQKVYMAAAPEWVFKRITSHQTDEEIMAQAIMANNVTCINNKAWPNECTMVIRVF